MSNDRNSTTQDADLANSPRFISLSQTIARHLLETHGVEDLERAIQLCAVVENGVFDYVTKGTSKLTEATNQSFTTWLNSGKKKLTRT